jgi:cytochrome P450
MLCRTHASREQAVVTTVGPYWDPYDTEIDSAPYGVWKRLRDEAPVYYNDRFDFYALSRFDDVEAAHLDDRLYSSSRGTVLELMSGGDMTSSGQMIFMDPPEHTALRGLVWRAFTARRIADLEPRIHALCAELLDPHVGGRGFDYFGDFAAQLPSRVISALLGVPDEEREEQRRNIDQLVHIEPDVGMINDTSLTAQIALHSYLLDLVKRRTRDPQDDLITALCEAEIEEDGRTRRLTPEETANFGLLLFTAGTETVGRLLGNAAVVLSEHPAERSALVADPALLRNAVEELLRYEPPSPVQGRWATAPISLHGVDIPEDSRVLLLTGAAARDDREFPDPDRFDVRRQMRRHVSFGYGIHFCVGANLARLEGRIALEETLQRFPQWSLGDGVVRQHTSTVRGYSAVPIEFEESS